MKQLFPDSAFKNEAADQPWMKSETDRMLDLYLDGAHPKNIAVQLRRNPKAVERRLEMLIGNERDKAATYEPRRRVSRAGKRFTENETLLIAAHKRKGVAVQATAKVLGRPVSDLAGEDKGKALVKQTRVFVPSLDLIMALRYAFHVYPEKPRLVTDKGYDDLVAEEVEFGGGAAAIERMRAEDVKRSPRRIKTLAVYLCELKEDKG